MSHALQPAHIALLSRKQALPALAQLALRFAVVVTKWDTRWRSRRALKQLEPHLLADIGLTPDQAAQEAALPFWKA